MMMSPLLPADARELLSSPVVVLGTLVLAVLLFAQLGGVRAAMETVGLSQPDQPYVELSFVDPDGLPKILPTDPTSLRVQAVAVNRSSERRTLVWEIRSSDPGLSDAEVLASGSDAVSPNSPLDIDRSVTVACRGERERIDVRMPAEDVFIGFWVDCARPATGG